MKTKTELKDVLHLYLGCACEIENLQRSARIVDRIGVFTIDRFNNDNILCKPILRPLSDMAEEEIRHIQDITPLSPNSCLTDSWVDRNSPYWKYEAKRTTYLLKQGFDLFGLIDSGQAIDKTKLTNN